MDALRLWHVPRNLGSSDLRVSLSGVMLGEFAGELMG